MKGRLIYGVLGQNHQANQGMFLMRLVGFLQVCTSTKSKAKGNDKRGVPREGTGVVFRLSSPVACFVQQNVETSLSRADKSVDTPCKIRKPRNFGLLILSR